MFTIENEVDRSGVVFNMNQAQTKRLKMIIAHAKASGT